MKPLPAAVCWAPAPHRAPYIEDSQYRDGLAVEQAGAMVDQAHETSTDHLSIQKHTEAYLHIEPQGTGQASGKKREHRFQAMALNQGTLVWRQF